MTNFKIQNKSKYQMFQTKDFRFMSILEFGFGICFVIWILSFVIIFSGCASSKDRLLITNLERDLTTTSTRLELVERENQGLRTELTLFRKSQNIDSRKFVEASAVVARELAQEIAKNLVGVHMTDRGLVINSLAEILFVSGTDSLSEEGRNLLDKVAQIIEGHFAANYIYIEGHTDNQSLAVFEWKSDWDFSFARAVSVLKYFSDQKHINPLQLSAAGFGQYRPKETNETKEGRRLNRRVEIIISPQRVGHVLF